MGGMGGSRGCLGSVGLQDPRPRPGQCHSTTSTTSTTTTTKLPTLGMTTTRGGRPAVVRGGASRRTNARWLRKRQRRPSPAAGSSRPSCPPSSAPADPRPRSRACPRPPPPVLPLPRLASRRTSRAEKPTLAASVPRSPPAGDDDEDEAPGSWFMDTHLTCISSLVHRPP